MALSGWQQLMAGAPWFRGAGAYPIIAYSEFVPPPRAGGRAYGGDPVSSFDEDDPWGWPVSEAEEAGQLRPGLRHLGECLVHALAHLAAGQRVRGLTRIKVESNPAWPAELAERSPALTHERHVTLLPLALSRTQDDKARVRWTVFGASEQGPARAFWRSFFLTPRREAAGEGEAFIRRLLQVVYGEAEKELADLRRAGFRILPLGDDLAYPFWREGPLPAWTAPYLWSKGQSARGVRYLLTFRPFAALPPGVRRAYLDGQLHLLPCPASLLFWGVPVYQRLQQDLPFAWQIPLLHLLPRHEAVQGLRIPQSGWMHEPHPDHPLPDEPQLPLHNTYRRTHRWAKLHRHEDELAVSGKEDKLAHVLFSTAANDLGLYGKPMARNVQLWDHHFALLLDGPNASAEAIRHAAHRVAEGGLFGYRFQFPAVRVGLHEVYWHRPLVAYLPAGSDIPVMVEDAPRGYLTAYPAAKPDLARPVELWPRLRHRPAHLAALELFHSPQAPHPEQTAVNVRMLLDTWGMRGEQPLPRSLARDLLWRHDHHTLEEWLQALPKWANSAERGSHLAREIEHRLEPPEEEKVDQALTYRETARRSFEVAYWKDIARLAEGRFRTKSNADCVLDPVTQGELPHLHRDLEALGDYLLGYYAQVVEAAGMKGKALVGDLPFRWQTDFDFSWMGGWLHNQEGYTEERDLIVVIPGRDRGRAVIMADHYDTAYMLDRYDPEYGGDGARLAAAGADDNHSATAALMRAAPVFLKMSKEGRLGCDVWLVHLTGEEFPSDCLGARHLSQLLVEGRMKMRLVSGRQHDLSRVRVQGLYVLDMVAHNSDREKDVFQIAPGYGRQSLWLAEQAHRATVAWNAGTEAWNKRKDRAGLGRGKRSPEGRVVPDTAAHLRLRGEVRLPVNPRSTLYNTDGQVFADAGIPSVLFMENYDINRSGYHDTHDTMANIDLDYGSAVAAIAIESVARAATEVP
jgi:hypothetical protein